MRLGLIPFALAIVVAASLAGYRYLQYYRLRFLRDAEARLSIDDRAGAIEALRAHILASPNDYATQLRLAELYTAIGQTDSASRIYARIRADSNDESLLASALTEQADLLDAQCSDKEKSADDFAAILDYPKAHDAYADLIRCREGSPYLNVLLTMKAPPSLKWPISFAAEALNTAIAKQAYIYWKEGDPERAKTVVSEPIFSVDGLPAPLAAIRLPVNLQEHTGPARRHLLLAEAVAAEADRLLSNRDHSGAAQAAAAFRFARDLRVEANGGTFDEESNRLQYNEAVSEGMSGHADTARVLLKELSTRSPDYATDKVQGVLTLIDRDQHNYRVLEQSRELKDRLDAAHGDFKKKRWIDAAGRFDSLVAFLLKSGRRQDDDLIAECRYNMASAYYNAGSDGAAKGALVDIQKTNPKYQPLVVADFLEKVERRQRLRAAIGP